MATRQQAEEHRGVIAGLIALALRDLTAFWRALNTADAQVAAEAVRGFVAEVGPAYSFAAGGAAADWYDELREEAAPRGRPYRAEVAPPPAPERLDALARWGVSPLFSGDPNSAEALSRLAGGLQRVVADGSRSTIGRSTARDPANARYARHASGTACAFCRMLATRGAVYYQNTAGFKSHDHCHCTAVPSWPDAPFQEAPYVAEWRDAYLAARAEAGGATKPILAAMRRSMGTN